MDKYKEKVKYLLNLLYDAYENDIDSIHLSDDSGKYSFSIDFDYITVHYAERGAGAGISLKITSKHCNSEYKYYRNYEDLYPKFKETLYQIRCLRGDYDHFSELNKVVRNSKIEKLVDND